MRRELIIEVDDVDYDEGEFDELGEPVTRCRDCEHMDHQSGGGYFCDLFYASTDEGRFCSWAVRRDA